MLGVFVSLSLSLILILIDYGFLGYIFELVFVIVFKVFHLVLPQQLSKRKERKLNLGN